MITSCGKQRSMDQYMIFFPIFYDSGCSCILDILYIPFRNVFSSQRLYVNAGSLLSFNYLKFLRFYGISCHLYETNYYCYCRCLLPEKKYPEDVDILGTCIQIWPQYMSVLDELKGERVLSHKFQFLLCPMMVMHLLAILTFAQQYLL